MSDGEFHPYASKPTFTYVKKEVLIHANAFVTVRKMHREVPTVFVKLSFGKVPFLPNLPATFQHCHSFNSGLVPLLLLSLFCLCIAVDPLLLSESTMVSCCHCFAIRVCSSALMFTYFQCGASLRRRDECPLKQICWKRQLSACQVEQILSPPTTKKPYNYDCGGNFSLTLILVKVCLPDSFSGLHNGSRKGQEDPY